MLGDMFRIPEDFPDVYKDFLNSDFVTQLDSGSKFSRVEMDKVIKMTFNKDTKTPSKLSVYLDLIIC